MMQHFLSKRTGNQPALRTKMADEGEYFVCQCFFTHNIFLKEYEAHFVFESEQQFKSDYWRVCTKFTNSKLISTSESSFLNLLQLNISLAELSKGKLHIYRYMRWTCQCLYLPYRHFVTEAARQRDSGRK